MPKRTRDYEKDLLERLKDSQYAAEYLNAVIEDEDSEKDFEERFLIALRDVARAHGISQLARETDLWRKSLYKMLSAKGNPRLSTLNAVLKTMGLKIKIDMEEARKTS